MPYRLPDVTHKQFQKTLSKGYGVTFDRRTIQLGYSGSFTAVHCVRVLDQRELETMYRAGPDDQKIGWDTIDNVCRNLSINPSEDKLWGLEI